jgi:hypothetical protein
VKGRRWFHMSAAWCFLGLANASRAAQKFP